MNNIFLYIIYINKINYLNLNNLFIYLINITYLKIFLYK